MIISLARRSAQTIFFFLRSRGTRAGLSLWCAGYRRIRGQDFEEVLYCVGLQLSVVFNFCCVPPFSCIVIRKAVFCAGSALQTWARSLTQLTAGRAIGGIGVGALRYGLPVLKTFNGPYDTATCSTLSPLYMAEISPPEVRGSLLALEQFSIVLGCVLGFWTGFLTRNSKFRLPLYHSCSVDELTISGYSSRESVLANTPGLAARPWDPSWFGGLRAPRFSASPRSSRPKRSGSRIPCKIASSVPR